MSKNLSQKFPFSTIFLILLGILLYNFLNGTATNLIFPNLNQKSLVAKFSDVHFNSPGNNFGGGIFWLTTKSLTTPMIIYGNGTQKKCYKQVRGIYYNSQRGQRLRPLDQETLDLLKSSGNAYSYLTMTGGRYTACEGDVERYSIFGYIKHIFSTPLKTDLSLRAFYHFDQSTTSPSDSSTYNTTATTYGSPTRINNGVYGGAFSFDGINDYIRIPSTILPGSSITGFSATFRLKQVGTGGVVAFSTEQGDSNRILFHPCANNNGFLTWDFGNSYVRLQTTSNIAFCDTNVRHHYAVTANTSPQRMEIWRDGQLVASNSSARSYYNDGRPFIIGAILNSRGGGTNSYFLSGNLDEIAFYNRALSSGEIQKSYLESPYQNTGVTTWHLIAGTQLNYATNSYIPNFANNFQYFNNVTPLGYIWDSAGGIGFIGGSISGNDTLIANLNQDNISINDVFSLNSGNSLTTNTSSGWSFAGTSPNSSGGVAQNTMRNLLVQGNILLSQAINVYEKKAILGNLGKKSVILGADINVGDVINTAKKNMNNLCEGRMYILPGSDSYSYLPSPSSSNILCYKDTTLQIDLSQQDMYKDKTILMNGGDVILVGSMNNSSPTLQLFVNNGNIFLQPDTNIFQGFNENGFPTTLSSDIVNSGMYLKGNFIINGLLLAGSPYSPTEFPNKLHLQGKMVSLNAPGSVSNGRILQVQSTIGSSYNQRISLENLFTWECGLNGIASDNSLCNGDSGISSTPFVILDGNYPSEILK